MFKTKLNKNKIPVHVALILDGNGRWATKRKMPRTFGHKIGIEAVKKTILAANNMGIKYLTFFAFSTENWKRDKSEIDEIFKILEDYIDKESDNYIRENYILMTSGDISALPSTLYNKLIDLTEKSKKNNGMILNLCLNYGAYDEIIRSINLLLKEKKDKITIKDLKSNLYTHAIPDPDFVIRTSGEQRLSNFMLIQIAYSELYFPRVFWPDFNERHFIKAIKNYQKRERRYGGLKNSLKG